MTFKKKRTNENTFKNGKINEEDVLKKMLFQKGQFLNILCAVLAWQGNKILV